MSRRNSSPTPSPNPTPPQKLDFGPRREGRRGRGRPSRTWHQAPTTPEYDSAMWNLILQLMYRPAQ